MTLGLIKLTINISHQKYLIWIFRYNPTERKSYIIRVEFVVSALIREQRDEEENDAHQMTISKTKERNLNRTLGAL